MERIEALNKHLNSLTAVNQDDTYSDDIRDTVDEINKELGIGKDKALETYTVEELVDELGKRSGSHEIWVDDEQEASVQKVIGDSEQTVTSLKGPARILINQD